MRIISKFKDYYDSAAGYGVDMTVVYERSSHTLPNWSIDPEQQQNVQQWKDIVAACDAITHSDRFRNIHRHSEHKVVFVGIAGKIYVGLALHYHMNDPKKELWKPIRYNDQFAQMYVWKPENLNDAQLDAKARQYAWGDNEAATLREWFTANESARVVENIDLFTKYNMASFVAVRASNGTSVEINPQLQGYGFQRMMDGFTAFQEISMFVTGVLAQKEQMTYVPTDKELLYARGHDDKSFKTPPTKKR